MDWEMHMWIVLSILPLSTALGRKHLLVCQPELLATSQKGVC